ncbi:MAG: hypothetical protein G01um101431_511 [Parcubacteria group bacterium Gr01-1014_31]|nr:MAG: hypothetical protein G01um101431_511 [Parcubacteria group bacterium Gr01-1014_31]
MANPKNRTQRMFELKAQWIVLDTVIKGLREQLSRERLPVRSRDALLAELLPRLVEIAAVDRQLDADFGTECYAQRTPSTQPTAAEAELQQRLLRDWQSNDFQLKSLRDRVEREPRYDQKCGLCNLVDIHRKRAAELEAQLQALSHQGLLDMPREPSSAPIEYELSREWDMLDMMISRCRERLGNGLPESAVPHVYRELRSYLCRADAVRADLRRYHPQCRCATRPLSSIPVPREAVLAADASVLS